MTEAEHFAAEDWADFVRQVTSEDQTRLMNGHLHDGCPVCTKAHHDWHSIRERAERDAVNEVPEASIRVAKATFAIQKTPSPFMRAFDAVKVLFDSHALPVTAGVRSAGGGRGRKVLYHMGDFLVDVQIQATREGRRTSVVGQVLCTRAYPESVYGVPVVFLRDSSVIGKCLTNRLGEFQLEFEGPSENLSVALGLREEGTAVSLGNTSVGRS
ncbi:MAG: hypothetical protein DMF89_09365 [Acidobacteria bacterium]|nr:MAG: hypothetical protein DMF90_03210 [Acidobacteriota bacterium]PYR50366.1 MAG: hypothetical protein DMF89_09365 [Acidobacteriota bacterium]